MVSVSQAAKILYYSTLFIFVFSFVVFESTGYAIISAFVFLVIGLFIAEFNLEKQQKEKFKKMVFDSYIPIAEKLKTNTNDRAITEIEFTKNGVDFRIFLVNGEETEVRNALELVINTLKDKDQIDLYSSIQATAINSEKDLPGARKILKNRSKLSSRTS